MLYTDQIFSEAFRDTAEGLPYTVSRRLAAHFPDRHMVEGEYYSFFLGEYARAGHCHLETASDVYSQFVSTWTRHSGVTTEPANAWFEVTWRGQTLDVIMMKWSCDCRQWIIADDRETAESFFAAVCGFTPEVANSVMVFDGGFWEASHPLHQAIQGMTFDNLVLESTLKTALTSDLPRFFEAEATYKRFGVPWKRGLLLTGPPGNGKTHAIKALVNQIKKPCLYVKSFAADNRDIVESGNMRSVFDRARQSAPCLLVLEDLDALINDENRAFFLNEMDGFAANQGVVTIASTNHPDRLDPAILDRPSRFDRKFVFDLPAMTERLTYLGRWNDSWECSLQLTPLGLERSADLTDGFSFATLKEVMLSATMAWMEQGTGSAMDEVLIAQIELIKAQNLKQTSTCEPTA